MWNQGHYLRLVIIGGGPAGLAVPLAAHRTGELGPLLDGGVVVVEQSERLGAGSIGGYAINSDSSGRTASCSSTWQSRSPSRAVSATIAARVVSLRVPDPSSTSTTLS